MSKLLLSHNPNDVADWVWIVVAFGIVTFVVTTTLVIVGVVVKRSLRRADAHRDREHDDTTR